MDKLLDRSTPAGKIWRAAILSHGKICRRRLEELRINDTCQQLINPSCQMSVQLSAILLYGIVIAHQRKLELLHDDVIGLLVNSQVHRESSRFRDATLPPEEPHVLTSSENDVDLSDDEVANTPKVTDDLHQVDNDMLQFDSPSGAPIEPPKVTDDLHQVDNDMLQFDSPSGAPIEPRSLSQQEIRANQIRSLPSKRKRNKKQSEKQAVNYSGEGHAEFETIMQSPFSNNERQNNQEEELLIGGENSHVAATNPDSTQVPSHVDLLEEKETYNFKAWRPEDDDSHLELLKRYFPTDELQDKTFDDVVLGPGNLDTMSSLYDICVLATHGSIKVEQENAYGSIRLSRS